MELNTASTMAREIMNSHGLENWGFGFDNAVRRFGVCRYNSRMIGLSATLTKINDEADVRDTILHEVAHALVGPGHGHGHAWRAMCVRIGAKPTRCADSEQLNTPTTKYTGTCPVCEKEFGRERLSANFKANGAWCPCTTDYKPEERLRWRQNR